MPITGKSARRLLPFIKPTDAPAINEWGNLLTAALDNDVEGGQGKLSERPAAALRGRVWMVQGDAVAANNGVVWWDTGATWVSINPGGSGYVSSLLENNTEYEPSATRPTFVTTRILSSTKTFYAVIVGGVEIGSVWSPEGVGGSMGFIVPAGVKFKVTGATTGQQFRLAL
jgi:hypothetical protein